MSASPRERLRASPRQVGDNIFIVEERVRRLADRLKKWVNLRRTPPKVQLMTALAHNLPQY